jgi:hypothetical protein
LDFLDLDSNLAEEDKILNDNDLKGTQACHILLKEDHAKSIFSHNNMEC